MKNLALFIILIALCAACSSIKHKSSNEIQLKPFKSAGKNDISEKFDVVIKADSVQRLSMDGLKFSIKIYNKSEDAMTVFNPMDSFFLRLINEKGVNVLYPYIPKILIDARPDAKFPFEAFNIIRIEINGKQKQDNLEEIKQIEIPARSSYKIFLSITKSLKPDTVKPYGIEAKANLPKGRYSLSIGLSVNEDNNKNQRFSISTKINYGL